MVRLVVLGVKPDGRGCVACPVVAVEAITHEDFTPVILHDGGLVLVSRAGFVDCDVVACPWDPREDVVRLRPHEEALMRRVRDKKGGS
jgi:hypothetical protein